MQIPYLDKLSIEAAGSRARLSCPVLRGTSASNPHFRENKASKKSSSTCYPMQVVCVPMIYTLYECKEVVYHIHVVYVLEC
jgi:hypothetical protein